MTDTANMATFKTGPSHRLPLLLGRTLKVVWPLADALVIVGLAILSGLSYHGLVYGSPGPVVEYVQIGVAVAAFRLLLQQPLAFGSTRPRGSLRFQFYLWNAAFLGVIAFAFLAKISHDYSRGVILLFYFVGLPALVIWQLAWKRLVREGYSSGALAVHRVLLIGTEDKIDEFKLKHAPSQFGLIVSDVVTWPKHALDDTPAGHAALKDGVRRVIELVRVSGVNEVVLLLPWSCTGAINACADMLMTAPVKVRLGPEAIFDRFFQVPMSQLGSATTLNLVRPPLTTVEIAVKRLIDFVGATSVLILTFPLLLLVALAIKLDSPGPVLFRQRRLGFNQREFEIYKFRTMSVTEDGNAVTQAVKGDPRITRLGRHLRRWNIDELPQLVNVVRGDMSLVGPRPHALTHDRDFELRVASYARRHNIKPGITGWAQVNGYRGPTDTVEKVEARVDHDLYYIDNWSLVLDMYILMLTVLSPKAYRNAL